MNFKIILALVLTASVLAFGGGWKLRDYQADGDALDAANKQMADVKTALIARDKLSAADAAKSKTLEEVLAAMKESKQEVRIVREKEYVTKPVYSSCVLPDNGLQLLNGRIANRHPAVDTGKR